jgi:hypothetical protein
MCERCETLKAALRAIREAHDANTPHHKALEKIDQIARSALDQEGDRGDDERAE